MNVLGEVDIFSCCIWILICIIFQIIWRKERKFGSSFSDLDMKRHQTKKIFIQNWLTVFVGYKTEQSTVILRQQEAATPV